MPERKINDISHELEGKCIFCQIVEGRLPADIVYSGENAIVALSRDLDKHPIIIPIKHIIDWADPNLDLETAQEIAHLRLITIRAVQKAYGVSGVAALALTGIDAGQTIPHAHEHIIPCPSGKKTFIVRENSFPLTRTEIANNLNVDINEQMQRSLD